jgi:hypothetical protein
VLLYPAINVTLLFPINCLISVKKGCTWLTSSFRRKIHQHTTHVTPLFPVGSFLTWIVSSFPCPRFAVAELAATLTGLCPRSASILGAGHNTYPIIAGLEVLNAVSEDIVNERI